MTIFPFFLLFQYRPLFMPAEHQLTVEQANTYVIQTTTHWAQE